MPSPVLTYFPEIKKELSISTVCLFLLLLKPYLQPDVVAKTVATLLIFIKVVVGQPHHVVLPEDGGGAEWEDPVSLEVHIGDEFFSQDCLGFRYEHFQLLEVGLRFLVDGDTPDQAFLVPLVSHQQSTGLDVEICKLLLRIKVDPIAKKVEPMVLDTENLLLARN